MSEQETAPQQNQLAMVADFDVKPVKLSVILDEITPTGEKLKAEDILDQEFTILRARSFPSKFPNQTHAYFVVGVFNKDQVLFNTVLGGAAVLDVLDGLCKAGFNKPLICTLRQVEGGTFGRYYVLE